MTAFPSPSPSPSSSLPPFFPATRSRTLLFISYRDSTVRRPTLHSYPYSAPDPDVADDEHERLIPANPNASSTHLALDVRLPPMWVDISDQVHDILTGAQSKIAALERLHAKHVLPGFTDRSAEEREIEALTTDITRNFRRCQSLINSISAEPTHTFPPGRTGVSHHETRAAQNVQRGLAAKVQELSASFRKKQRIYMETLQGHAVKNKDLLVASGALSLKGFDGMSDLDDDMQVAARGKQEMMLKAEGGLEMDVQQRDREISEIAKSITSLADLFKDLSSLVIDQGTLLDSIEYNVEQTSVHISEAVKELKTAEKYQKNSGRRQCIFLLLLIILALALFLTFKPRRHAAPSTPAETEVSRHQSS